ncbi:DUF998 domain-containing protein [Geojedonia litorea]|uniref:DUF998 domain-containing protein n=1 Tax=Geojedonia litorea TaxID=1268269 RepID=A0ABV9N256_9FLAO
MIANRIFWLGIIGASLFIVTALIGGFMIADYSHIENLISESYAIDTEYGFQLRFYGFIPSSIALTLFGLLALRIFPKSNLTNWGFLGFALFYGLGTLIVSLFPCDAGCNKTFIHPSLSQVIHNISGGLTYLIVPLCLIFIGLGSKNWANSTRFSNISLTLGGIALLFVFIFFNNYEDDFIGLYQRIIEGCILVWVIYCSFFLKNYKTS